MQAIILGRNKIDVPSELIFYDDDATDFTDDPGISVKDFETGELIWNIKTSLPIEKHTQLG